MTMTMEEAIKYLIKPVATSTEIGEEKQKEFEAYNMAIEALKDRPTGEWLKRQTVGDVDFAYCSKCGQPIIHGRTSPLWSYCPNCGADMRGEEE